MQRPIVFGAILFVGTAAWAQQPAQQPATQQQPADQGQQQSTQADPYQGQSNPPADDTIVTAPPEDPQPPTKPNPGTPAAPAADAAAQTQPAVVPQPVQPPAGADAAMIAHPSSVDPSVNYRDADVTGNDDGIVGIAKEEPSDANSGAEPALRTRSSDPDGDIVHVHALEPGEVADGTTIRVRLLTRLSTEDTQAGATFRSRVASDVLQDGQVLIPAGAEIDGRVVQVASGTSSSHGTMLLRPDTVILLDGTRFQMDAQVSGAPGTRIRINGEGYINPGSRLKKDGMEYGGGVGAGVITGALIGGPVGAVTGGIIGAGAITLHLMSSHSDATLEPGTVLLFTLNSRLDLRSMANSTGD